MRAKYAVVFLVIVLTGAFMARHFSHTGSTPARTASPESPHPQQTAQHPAPAPAQKHRATTPFSRPAVNVPPRPAAAATAFQNENPAAVLAIVQDTKRPLTERHQLLTDISRRKDTRALDILKTVAAARVYLNHAAVEAMGNFSGSPAESAAAAYLQARLADPDSQIACAAIRALARLRGAEAVPGLGTALQDNHVRPDGHQEIVCTAAVQALQDICSTSSVPALLSELERSEERGWTLEYGSRVLAALHPTDTAEGRRASAAYAQRLAARIPEDKLARAYFEEKIAEAINIAGM